MQEITSEQQKKLNTLKRVVEAGGELKDAVLGDILAENLVEALKGVTVKAEVKIPPFPSIPEQKAPIVNVEAPQVTVEAPVVNVDTTEVSESVKDLHNTAKEIKDILSIKEEFDPVQVYDKNGKLVDWDKLTRSEGRPTAGMFDLDILNALTRNYTIRFDNSAYPISYVGKADIGSATSSPLWQIFKLDETSGAITTFADGNASFDNVWDNRTSLSYS